VNAGRWAHLLAIGGMILLAGAATQPATQPAPSISALIADLSSPDFSVREEAERKLSDLGPSVEPALRAALRGIVSDEARARLGHVLDHFDQCSLLHASITMHYINAPLAKILKDFAGQAGADLGTGDPALAPYLSGHTATLDLDNADFWTAMKALNEATGLEPCVGPGGLKLSPPGVSLPFPIPTAHVFAGVLVTPFPLVETQARAGNENQPAGESMISVSVNVIPEPKLHVVGVVREDWVQECIDDTGQSLTISGIPRIPTVIERGRQWSWTQTLVLAEGNSAATKMSRLKGKLDFFVQTRGEVLEIPSILRARNVTKSDADISLTVLSCSKIGRRYTLSIRVQGMTMRDMAFRDFITTAQLLDAAGRPIARQSIGAVGGADGLERVSSQCTR
jgi:hypothetical protein